MTNISCEVTQKSAGSNLVSRPLEQSSPSILEMDSVRFELPRITSSTNLLVRYVVTTPGLLAAFIERPEFVRQQFIEVLGEMSDQHYRILEKMVELFLPRPVDHNPNPVKIRMGCQQEECSWW